MCSADQIKTARERLGESQADFAARFSVNQSTVARWETNGVPTRGTAQALVSKVLAEIGPTTEAAE